MACVEAWQHREVPYRVLRLVLSDRGEAQDASLALSKNLGEDAQAEDARLETPTKSENSDLMTSEDPLLPRRR